MGKTPSIKNLPCIHANSYCSNFFLSDFIEKSVTLVILRKDVGFESEVRVTGGVTAASPAVTGTNRRAISL